MGQVIIRDLDDEVIAAHARQAEALGRSLEEQLRTLVTEAAQAEREALLAEAAAIRARNRPPPPGQRWPTAEEMIREDRDSR